MKTTIMLDVQRDPIRDTYVASYFRIGSQPTSRNTYKQTFTLIETYQYTYEQ
jgi:hypothetical protein